MIDATQFERISHALPILQQADEAFKKEFQRAAFFARIPSGHDVFLEGDRVEAIALLLSGVVRVYKIGETGREITLYRFGNGSSCILSANAILSQKTFPAIATVEEDAEAVMIPADTFREWVHRYVRRSARRFPLRHRWSNVHRWKQRRARRADDDSRRR